MSIIAQFKIFLFNSRQTLFYDYTEFVSYIGREMCSLKEEMITHKSHWKKKTVEKKWSDRMAEEKMMPALCTNDPHSREVILDDHSLKKCSFMNKV